MSFELGSLIAVPATAAAAAAPDTARRQVITWAPLATQARVVWAKRKAS